MGPKLDPNRIFDAEALRKPLGSLLKRSWSLLEPKKVILESLLAALGGLSRLASAKKGPNWDPKKGSKMGPPLKTAPRALQEAPGSVLDQI